MKPHILIKFSESLTERGIPFWGAFILDKSREVTRFGNEVDAILRRYAIDCWITREYSGAPQPTCEEIEHGLNRIYRVILRRNTAIPGALIDDIRLSPLVEEVSAMGFGVTELPRFSRCQSETIFDKSRENIYLKAAHLYSQGIPDIKVAILDTGADLDHVEVSHAIHETADFVNFEGLDTREGFIGDLLEYDDIPEDEVGHGTHVAGIISGKGLRMPTGVAPRCKLIVVRVLATIDQGESRVGAGLIDNINVGLKWAVDQGADVVNMSLGVKHEHGGLPHEDVVKYALAKGVTIVAASGNDGTSDKYYPGALPGVIAVGAVDRDDQVASFSTYGRHVSLVAPGTDIMSSYVEQGYAVSSGTSQAAPFVSGAIALLKSYALEQGVTLTDGQVKYLLERTSDKLDHRYKTDKGGYGRINLVDSLKLFNHQLHGVVQ